jgi:hypothetical protein
VERHPREAYERLVRWNDRYHLDGVDPNSYAGIGWVFGLHDRPWTERPVFGTVRSMTRGGLCGARPTPRRTCARSPTRSRAHRRAVRP